MIKLTKIRDTFFAFIFTICSFYANAQIVEKIRLDDSTGMVKTKYFLNGAGIRFEGSNLWWPSVNIKLLKLTNILGNQKEQSDLGFYMYSNLFLGIGKYDFKNHSLRLINNDILNQTGGLLNVAFSNIYYADNDILTRDIKGLKIDFRAGAKVVNAHPSFNKLNLLPIAHASVDLRYNVFLSKKYESSEHMAGNLSFRIYALYNRVFNVKDTYIYYETPKGNLPNADKLSLNGELNLFVTDKIYLSGGYSSSILKYAYMDPLGYFSINYLAK